MKNNKFLIISGVAVLVIAVILLGSYFKLFAVTGEFGWIPFTEQSNSFTNQNNACTDVSHAQFSSKYWDIDWNGFYMGKGATCEELLNIGFPVFGGDGKLIIDRYDDVRMKINFNEDLQDKSFMVDYGIDSSRGSTISFMGEKINVNDGIVKGRIEIRKSIISDKSNLYINGQLIKELDSSKPLFFEVETLGQFILTLSNPRYKPLFDCYVDNDEVLTFDEFTSGSIVGINSLNYPVKKFCINQPPVIRSFTDRGIATDTNGELLLKLSEGGSYNVKSDETLRIYYVTEIQEGFLRCPTNQAYNTKTKKCENILSEGEPEQTGNEIIQVDVGANQISKVFNYNSGSLFIGDLSILASKPSFVCDCDNSYGAGSPSNDCWQTSINGVTINNEELINLNDFISIKSSIYDYVRKSDNCIDLEEDFWKVSSIISINKEGLSIEKDPNIIYENLTELKVNINNKLANFDSPHSGIKVKTTYLLLDKITEKYINLPLNLGINSVDVPLERELLGQKVVEIIPYIRVNDKIIFGNSVLKANYDLNNEGIIKEVIVEKLVTNYTLILILLGIIISAIIVIVVLIRRR